LTKVPQLKKELKKNNLMTATKKVSQNLIWNFEPEKKIIMGLQSNEAYKVHLL